jgi:hypothetical protein
MKEIERNLKILGIYQLISGIFGILMCAYFFGSIPFQLLTSVGMYGFCAYCGFLLLKKQYENGLNLSIINQALQIISFGIFGFALKYTSGFYAGFGIDLTDDIITRLDFGINTWQLYLNANPDLATLYINVIPILILGFIYKSKKRLELKDI